MASGYTISASIRRKVRQELLDGLSTVREISERYSVSKGSIYRIRDELAAEDAGEPGDLNRALESAFAFIEKSEGAKRYRRGDGYCAGVGNEGEGVDQVFGVTHSSTESY